MNFSVIGYQKTFLESSHSEDILCNQELLDNITIITCNEMHYGLIIVSWFLVVRFCNSDYMWSVTTLPGSQVQGWSWKITSTPAYSAL